MSGLGVLGFYVRPIFFILVPQTEAESFSCLLGTCNSAAPTDTPALVDMVPNCALFHKQ